MPGVKSLPKTILIALNDLSFGGAQRTAVAEANEFARQGLDVFVLTLLSKKRELGVELKLPPDRLHTIPFRGLFDLPAFIRLVSFLYRTKPDLILSNLFFTNTLIRLAKLFYWKPVIIVREGNVPVEKSFFVKTMDVWLSLVTRRIIVNAAVLREPLSAFGIPKRKIAVVYNGVGANFFAPSGVTRSEARGRFSVSERAFTIAAAASLTKKKGIEYLIEAVKELHKAFPALKLLIAGDGPERDTLEAKTRALRLEANITFLGAFDDVQAVYAASDVFALSSLWEGLPNALLEAMASGLPVVVTDVGGISEVVRNGENGLLVPARDARALAEALARLAREPKLRQVLGTRARENARRFSWERHAKEALELARL